MQRRLIIIVLATVFTCASRAQLPAEEIGRIENALNTAVSDSARYNRYFDLSQAYRFSNVDSALYYAEEAIDLSQKMRDPALEANALSQKGFIVLEMGDIPASLQYQMAALRLSEKFSDPVIQGFTLNRIGNVYLDLGEYKKAIDYYRQAIVLFRSVNQEGFVQNEMSNIGSAYEMMGTLDSSSYYQQKVYQYSISNTDRYAITYGEMRQRLGKLEARLGNYNLALMHYRAGILESLKDVDRNNLAVNYVQLAQVFYQLHVYDSSLLYARRTIETANTILMKRAMYDASTLLVNLFKLQNKPDSALVYAEMAASAKDSMYGYKKIQALQRILLDEQEHQQQLQEEKDRLRQKYRILTLLSALAVLMVIGVILFRNNRSKQRTNSVLQSTLTNLRATQAQLIQSEKMASLGELTAGIAHEIQNPLNFVNNFSELNKELLVEMNDEIEKGSFDEVKKIAKDVRDNQEKINFHGKRADAIVKSMLQHSRASSGQKEPTDINALVDEYLRLAYHGLRAKDKSFNATVRTDFDETLGKINVAPQDIGRVILNLITNAFYAVTQRKKENADNYEPTVIVTTKKLKTQVEVKVRDNGNGIPQKLLDKIFQPFFTTKPTGEGTGLGLSLSYDIIKGHSGELKVDTKEKEFTEFTILLPS